MPSAQYYIEQARTLLSWARTTTDKTYALMLRHKAGKLLEQANEAHAAVPDLNPILAEFNEQQLRERGPDEKTEA